MEKWAVDIAGAMEHPSPDVSIEFGVVLSVHPLAIKTKEIVIKKKIYINPAYVLEDEGYIAEIFDAELKIPVHVPVFTFLKQFHTLYVLKPGDIVTLIKQGVYFYVAEKVVLIS